MEDLITLAVAEEVEVVEELRFIIHHLLPDHQM